MARTAMYAPWLTSQRAIDMARSRPVSAGGSGHRVSPSDWFGGSSQRAVGDAHVVQGVWQIAAPVQDRQIRAGRQAGDADAVVDVDAGAGRLIEEPPAFDVIPDGRPKHDLPPQPGAILSDVAADAAPPSAPHRRST